MERFSPWCAGALVRTFAILLALAIPGWGHAFGLKTHIWIAQKLVADVQSSCRLTIETIPLIINEQVCQSIREHPGAFLAGALGPDAYPDIITGQVTTHPGIPSDWQTADWLVHMYATTAPGATLAFASGYLVHAAGDVFAHTYVNAYAGDIFVLSDERAVERRHFVLEKYIDARLPDYVFDPDSLKPPTIWLRDKLIHNGDAARNSGQSGVALHVAAMYGVYRGVNEMVEQLDGIEKDASRLLADLAASIIESEAKIASGEVRLKVVRELLSANEAKLKAEQGLYDAANAALQAGIKELQDNKHLIDQLTLEAQAARAAAEAAKNVGTQAIDAVKNAENELASLRKRLVDTPATVSREVCRNETVKNGVCDLACLGGLNPFCRRVCKDGVRKVCELENAVNQVYTGLTGQIANAERTINEVRARGHQASLDAVAHAATEASKLQEKAAAEARRVTLEVAKAGLQAAHDLRQAKLNLELDATSKSRNQVDELTASIRALREKVIDTKSIKETLADLVARSDILSGLAKNWAYGMDVAGTEFIIASNRIAAGMLIGKASFASNYLDWWKCYGHAYGGVPVQFGQATCAYEDFLGKIEEEVNKIVEKTLPPPFGEVYGRFLKLKVDIKTGLKKEVSNAILELTKLAAPDATTADFIDLLARPEHATKDKLNAVFATTEGAKGKPLLIFPKVSDLIDADLGLANDTVDPEKFYALKNAVTLSKLALADISAVKGLVWVIGANPDFVTTPASPGRTSILFEMVRSIDGNHQWQPFGLPYASAGGAALRPAEELMRRYGYGPGQERPGFSLFVNPTLRRNVFMRIFDGPVSGSLANHLVGYPFQECDRNPFAVAFTSNGSAATEDGGCKAASTNKPMKSKGEFLRSLATRLRLNPYSR